MASDQIGAPYSGSGSIAPLYVIFRPPCPNHQDIFAISLHCKLVFWHFSVA